MVLHQDTPSRLDVVPPAVRWTGGGVVAANAMTAVWTSVVTAVSTLIAVLLTATFTHRYGMNLGELARHDQLRINQRQAVVDVLCAGDVWVRTVQERSGYVILNQLALHEAPWSARIETVDAALRRSLMAAGVVVADPALLKAFQELRVAQQRAPALLLEFEELEIGEATRDMIANAAAKVLKHAAAANSLLVTIEKVSNSLFST